MIEEHKKIGRQDPTTSHIIEYKETDGDMAVQLYELTGRTAMPWQEAICYDILAMDANGRWIHSKFGMAIPRRNGKNEVLIARELYGLAIGERILHTAHLISTAHAAWERLCKRLDAADIDYTSIKAKGQELIELENGGRIEFRTRTAKGGLGEGFDLLVIDEAQEYQTDQETALNYVVTDSHNPQTIFCGTPPTPISSGTVFKNFRTEVLQGKKERAGWVEWSVDEIQDPTDRSFWYETNPSLGLTLDEISVADEVGFSEEKRLDFNIQRLGYWVRYNLQSAISAAAWHAVEITRQPALQGKLAIGIKFSRDGVSAALAVGVKTTDGKTFVEVVKRIDFREGVEPLVRFLIHVKAETLKVIADGENGQKILSDEMARRGLPRPLLPTVKQVIEANQRFETGIYQGEIVHMEQPTLTAIVTNSEHRAIGSKGGFGFKPINAEHDIAVMDSAILAAWGAATFKEGRQRVFY